MGSEILNRTHQLVIFGSILLFSAVYGLDANANIYTGNKVVVCYVAGWAAYRTGRGAFTWENVDPSLCSHIIYAFATLDNEALVMKSSDPFLDLEEGGGRGQYKKMSTLKKKNPTVQILLSIGGWSEGSEKYSRMAMSWERRSNFVQQAVNFIGKFGFDGLDVNWEYPGSRGGRAEDRDNFVLLLKELYQELQRDGRLLTASLAASPSVAKIGYNVPEISKNVDLLLLNCYDYHGSWSSKTGHNAPLHSSSWREFEDDRLSVENTVSFYIKQGAPRNKLVLGIPLYGRTFNLVNSLIPHVGSSTYGTGFHGPYTQENGFMSYNEICKLAPSWTERWDEVAKVPYMHNGYKWISFDNERSVAEKARFASAQGLAGAMVWSIDHDDFLGECSSVRYPLLRSINSVLRSSFAQHAEVPTSPATLVKATTEQYYYKLNYWLK